MARSRRASLAAVFAIAGGLVGLVAQEEARPRQLQANGVSLSYVEEGSGTPVVFAHGAVGDLRFWEPQRHAVGARHRFVAYTYRYHGSAPWPDDGSRYTAETHAADLAAFIAGLNAGPAHVVGLSYGGLVAALVAKDHPELVRTLTLAEPALFSLLAETPESKPARDARDAWTKAIAPVVAAIQAGDAVAATKRLVDVVTNEGPGAFEKQPEAVRQLLLDNARTLPVLFGHPAPAVSCDALSGLKMPTLVVGGERTPIFFSAVNDAVVRCIPDSRLVVIPKANHMMSAQNPAAFNEALLQFLGQQQRSSRGPVGAGVTRMLYPRRIRR